MRAKRVRRIKKLYQDNPYNEVILAYDNTSSSPSPTIYSSSDEHSSSTDPDTPSDSSPEVSTVASHSHFSSDAVLRASCRNLGPIDEVPEDIYRESRTGADQGSNSNGDRLSSETKVMRQGSTKLLCPQRRARSFEDLCSVLNISPGDSPITQMYPGQEMSSITMSMSLDSVSSDGSDMFPNSLYETLEGIYTDVALAHVRAQSNHNFYESLKNKQVAMPTTSECMLKLDPPYEAGGISDTIAL